MNYDCTLDMLLSYPNLILVDHNPSSKSFGQKNFPLPEPNFLEDQLGATCQGQTSTVRHNPGNLVLIRQDQLWPATAGRYTSSILLFLSLLFDHHPKHVTNKKGRYDDKKNEKPYSLFQWHVERILIMDGPNLVLRVHFLERHIERGFLSSSASSSH